MRKRKTKDSKMILMISNWLNSHLYSLILISMIVVIANGSEVEKPLIVENYTLPQSTPLENHTSRSMHHATVRDRNLDVTTMSNYDSIEYDNLSGDLSEGGQHTVVRTITESSNKKLTTKNVELSSVPHSEPLRMSPVSIENSTSRSSSTPSKQRSYDISVNKTNDIHPELSLRANKNTDSVSGLSGADVLAFANIEEESSKGGSDPSQGSPINGNNTLKSLMDWTHILKTMETSTEHENEVTSSLNESRTDIIPNLKISTSPIVPPFSSLLPTTIQVREILSKSSPVPGTTMTTASTPQSFTSERPTTVFNKNLLTIGEVYRKKSEAMATMRPSDRIDVHEYYRTETAPYFTTTTTTTTEEPPTTTTTWMTTNFDKRNTDAELFDTTTDAPIISTTLSRRQNYRFTTLSPPTIFVTMTPSGQETTTEEMTTETPTTTTAVAQTTSKEWSPVVISTTKSTSTSFQSPIPTFDSTVSSTSTKETVSTEIVTKIPKTASNIITTQTIATDNDNIWIVTDESTIPVTSTTTVTSTVASTMSEEIGSTEAPGTDVTAIVVISLSVVGVVAFLLLMGFLFIIRKRQNQTKYANRCRPVGLDAYSLDNVSVYNSVRRKANNLRLSKRSYGNSAFEDPNLQSHVLSVPDLATFVQNKYAIYDEYKDIPVITSRIEEMPVGCEDKNRYSNVIPLPETRVYLQRQNDDEKTEYINANYVKGPQDTTNYYIATQAPLDNTIHDFWRMVWEQQCKVIIMATDLSENGVEKCAQYLPASVVLDNIQTYGNYQITLKSREVKEKYALSTIHIKHLETKSYREIVHFWYSWPETGVPTDETSLIAMLLEARSYSRLSLPEQRVDETNVNNNQDIESGVIETNGKMTTSSFDKNRSLQRTQTPIIVHCSPGTSRTGTIIACDIVLRTLEIPPRQIDIPKIVYTVRRGRANAVQTKQQYEFIYKVAHVYATKLNGPSID